MLLNFPSLKHAIINNCRKVHKNLIESDNAFLSGEIGADGEPTTTIDKELENAVIRTLNEFKVGGHLLSEEIGLIELDGEKNDLLFVVDPLDGTTNAKLKFPYYSLSVAVLDRDIPVHSFLYEYPTGNIFSADIGQGATYNQKKIKVSQKRSLDSCQILLARPFSEKESEISKILMLNTQRTRITGCPSLDIAMVALGTFEAYIDFHFDKKCLKTHDLIAASLILQEAGGALYGDDGRELKLSLDTSTTYNVFATNSDEIYKALLNISTLRLALSQPSEPPQMT